MSDPERIAPGLLIAERYRVGPFIGRGAMGIVYEGEHVRVGRKVAIKVLTRAWSAKPAVRERFEAEARSASAAGHPNVIQVFDVGELPDQRLYLVMEFVDGQNLYSLLWATGPLAPARACRLIRDAAFGVRAAHAQGVIHRDLKLENVMVQSLPEGEVVKVLDFGIAAGVITKQRSTMAGMCLGTPEYMAPEQVDGADPTERFDIYALGVMLFELLTKQLPIAADDPFELMARKQNFVAKRVTELRPELPAALDQLIAECLEIEPSKRPPSCAAFLSRLVAILAELEIVAERPTRPSGPGDQAPPRPSRLTRADAELSSGSGSGGGILSITTSPVATPHASPATGSLTDSFVDGPKANRWPWIVGGFGALALGSMVVLALADSRDQAPEQSGEAVVENADESAERKPSEPAPELEDTSGRDPELEDSSGRGPELEDSSGRDPEFEDSSVRDPDGEDTSGQEPDPEDNSSEPRTPVVADESTSARCVKNRASAADGRANHDWDRVLAAARKRECWARATERKLFETQAYMELGRFAECLRAGNNLADTEARKWVALCKQRLE